MRNLTFKAAMLNDSRTTVNRRSTDGQSQRHYKQTPLSKRWKVLMTLVFLFTFAIGNVWAQTPTTTIEFKNSSTLTAKQIYEATVDDDADLLVDGKAYFGSSNGTGVSGGNVYIYRLAVVFQLKSAARISITLPSASNNKTYTFRSFPGNVNYNTLIKNAVGKDVTTELASYSSAAPESVEAAIYAAYNGKTYKNLLLYDTPVLTELGSVTGTATKNVVLGPLDLKSGETSTTFAAGYYALYLDYGSSTGRIGSLTLTPVATGYSITYHCNGATSGCPSNVASGATALPSTLATPAKTGYDFVKWYTDEGLTTPATAGAALSANANLYAGWTAHTHSLTWNIPGDATITNSETYTHGTVAYGTAIVAPTLSRTGYDFLGWDATPAATMPDNDLEYTATWQTEAQKFDITYSNLKGSDVSAYPTKYSKGIGIAEFAPLADIEGFHFTGWSPASISTTDEGDKEIEAQWIPTYSVTYNLNGGTGTLPTETAKYATQEFTLAAQGDIVAPTNKQFLGWKDQDGNKYAAEANFTMPGKAVTLTAYWAAKVEDVIYLWEGAASGATEVGGTASSTRNAGTAYTNEEINANTKVHGGTVDYYCLCLSGKADYSDKFVKLALAQNIQAGDKVEVTAFYNKKDDSTGEDKVANARPQMHTMSGTVIFVDPNNLPNLNTSGSPAVRTFTVPSGINTDEVKMTRNQTGSNTWIAKLRIYRESYIDEDLLKTVTFNYNDGVTPNATIQLASGQAVAKPADPTWAKHRFNEWQLSGSTYNFSSPVTSNITLVANWTQLYTISFAAGEGSGDAPAAVADKAQGETFTVPANTYDAPTGKVFAGWNDGSADYAEGDTYTVGTANVVLTAQWIANNFEAKIGTTFYATFAEAIAAVAAGQTIQLLADCSYDAAWNLTVAGTVTLDLNGHDLTYNGAGRGVQVHNGAKLILEDGTATTAPTIDLTADPLSRSAITYTSGTFDSKDGMAAINGGEIEINSGRYLATEGVILVKGNGATATVNDGVLISRDNGVLMGNGTNSADFRNYVINVHGGILLGEIVSTGYASMVIYHPNVGELNIDGGTLVSTNGPAVVCRGGESNITGGTIVAQGSGSGKCGDASLVLPAVGVAYDFKSAYPGVSSFDAKISGDANVSGAAGAVKGIYAGTTPTTAEEDAVAISGGTFNSPVAQALCAENYAPKDNGDGTYGVKPLATSIDIEGYYVDGSHGTVADALAAHNYTLTADMSDSKKVAWDNNSNAYDKGLKIKEDAKTFSFDVAADKLVAFKTGIISGATLSVNGGAAEVLTITDKSDASIKTRYYYSENAQSFVFTTTTASYNIIKSVTIEDPYVVTFNANGGDEVAAATFYGTALTLPSASKGTEVFKGWYDAAEAGNLIGKAGDSYTPTANVTLHAQWETVSSDNTLSALEVDGVALADFDPEKHIYNIVCEYGHTPEITLATATAAAQGATVTIVNTPEDGDGYKYIQANVIPASGTPIGYNQVRYTNLPKQGVTLIKVTIPNGTGNTQTIEEANITGYIGGTATQKLENGKHKLGSGGHFIGMTLAEGTFQENDIVVVNVETVKADLMRVFKENTAAEANVVASSTANMTVGDNYVLLGETTTNSLYLRRGTDGENYQKDWNPFIGSFEVQRLMDPFIAELKVGDALATIDEEANPKTITIEVPASTDITALTPSIKAYANGGATVTPADPQDFGAGAVEYTVTSYYGETTTYQVTVTKAEASHDATLSALSVAGYSLSPAFDPAVLTYNVELPKGSVIGDLPAVSYTKNHVGATAVKTDATVLPGATTIVVTAEDGLKENKKTYTINFTVSTKDKVVIFDGATDEALRTVPAALETEGFNWVKNSNDADKFKYIGYTSVSGYTHAIATGGSSNASRNIAVTIPSKYEVQFEIAQASNSDAARHAYVGAANNTAYADALFSVESASKTDGQKATSEALAGGKTYYIHSDNSINILEINLYIDRVSEAPAISAQPAALAACDAATNTNALSVTASVEAGTLSYQWYKVVEEGDDVAVGTNSNEFVPTAVGEYYVVVTNTEGTYKPSSKKSEVVAVSLKPAVEITTAPLNQRAEAGNNATLTVVAANAVNYAWYTCDEDGSNADAVDGASGADKTSLVVAVTEGLQQYYKVVVTDDCGRTDEAIAKVSQFVPATPANVTESIVWDWTSSAWPASGEVQFTNKVADGTDFSKDYELLANADAIVPNNAAFRSDMLYGKGQWVWRSGNKFFQGTAIKFTTEVAGLVRINYRSTGNNKEVQVTIAGTPAGKNKTSDFQWSEYVEVPAGAVEILCLSTDANKSLTRVQKIEFLAVGHERAGLVVGDLGTVCLPNASIARGVTVYEYQGADEIGKIVFDELGANELLEAGKPYIFQVKETNARFYYNTDPAVATPDNSTALKGNLGAAITFQPGSAEAANVYFVKDHAFWMAKNTGVKIGQYRAYLQMNEVTAVTSSAPAPGRRRISMAVNGEQVATGIENTGFESEAPRKVLINGELFIIRGEKMYDAKGQLVK